MSFEIANFCGKNIDNLTIILFFVKNMIVEHKKITDKITYFQNILRFSFVVSVSKNTFIYKIVLSIVVSNYLLAEREVCSIFRTRQINDIISPNYNL